MVSFCFPFPQDGKTPLYQAATNGHSEAIQVLAAAGANLEAANKVRCSASRFNICF
jgi:ankyrin repeat protein